MLSPFREWEVQRAGSDYRSRETQASVFTRKILKQPEYLLEINRVNPGPLRNTRAGAADSKGQTPHNTLVEDRWGWDTWLEPSPATSESSNNLLESGES